MRFLKRLLGLKILVKSKCFCIWWDYQGVIHFEILKSKKTVNSELYCVQLEMVNEKLLKIRNALVNRRGVLFLHDNTKPYTIMTQEKSLYSPDLAPSDFYLFY